MKMLVGRIYKTCLYDIIFLLKLFLNTSSYRLLKDGKLNIFNDDQLSISSTSSTSSISST
jgi:hypothetical protein